MRKGGSRQRRRISGRRSRWKRSSGSRWPSGSRRKSIIQQSADGCRWSSGWFSCSLWWFFGWNPAGGRWTSILFWIPDEISHPTHFRHSPRWMASLLNYYSGRWQTLPAFLCERGKFKNIWKKMLDWIQFISALHLPWQSGEYVIIQLDDVWFLFQRAPSPAAARHVDCDVTSRRDCRERRHHRRNDVLDASRFRHYLHLPAVDDRDDSGQHQQHHHR